MNTLITRCIRLTPRGGYEQLVPLAGCAHGPVRRILGGVGKVWPCHH
jgi:hypothetical protein